MADLHWQHAAWQEVSANDGIPPGCRPVPGVQGETMQPGQDRDDDRFVVH